MEPAKPPPGKGDATAAAVARLCLPVRAGLTSASALPARTQRPICLRRSPGAGRAAG